MNNRFIFMISRLNHALKNQTKKAYKTSGIDLTNSQLGILFALEKGNPLSMSSLSDIVKTDNSVTYRLVESLIKAGYVRREQNNEDLRQQLIIITASGKEVTLIAVKIIKKFNQKLKNLFTEEEVNIFNNVLSRLVTELDKSNFI